MTPTSMEKIAKVMGWSLRTLLIAPGVPLRHHYGTRDGSREHSGFDCVFCKGERVGRKEDFKHTDICPYQEFMEVYQAVTEAAKKES